MSREEAGRRKAGSTPGCGRQEKACRQGGARENSGRRKACREEERGRQGVGR